MTNETGKPSGFSKFNLSHNLNRALSAAEFSTPTPVQEATIPLGLDRKDILACAQTGTGKTAAFLLPLITHLENNENETALIMGPTREIVQQIADAARLFTQFLPSIGVCAIIGGGRIDRQQKALQKKPRLIIGTPGRLNDFIARRKINLSLCTTLVFDEADRMLDMGFAPQIDLIVKHIPAERQTLMFSATIAPGVEKISKTYMKGAKLINVGQKETAPELLRQKAIITTLDQKELVLHSELKTRQGSVLIFAETQRKVEKLGYKLRESGFEAETIHGGRTQGQRFRALKSFRDGDVNILVATDVASRGLDIGNISHVINFDLPSNPEDFLHRIGRTARNGKDGDALTLMAQSDFSEFRGIKKYMADCEMIGEFTKAAMASTGGGKRFGGSGGKRFGGGASSGGGGFRRGRSGEGGGASSGGGRFGRSSESRGGNRFGAGAPRGERPAFGAPRGERPAFGAPRGERPAFGAPRGERPAFGAPRGERPAFGAPRGERPSFSGPRPAPRGERPAFGAPRGERPAFRTESKFGAGPRVDKRTEGRSSDRPGGNSSETRGPRSASFGSGRGAGKREFSRGPRNSRP